MQERITTSSPQETDSLGRLLAPLLRAGDVIALGGDLGAGKTHLVQGVAHGLGIAEPVTSPTFNLLLVHSGALPLYHFDLYRLEREDDLEDIDFYETLEGDGVSMIEWGDRFPDSLPSDRLLVVIDRAGETERLLQIDACGARSEELANGWIAAWRSTEAGR